MTKISERLEDWRIENVRGSSQVNKEVMVRWFNKWLHEFQSKLLEFVSWKNNTAHRFKDIEKNKDEYELPLTDSDVETNVQDFYSIIQLRVAYDIDKNWNPIYRICYPIDFGDYNFSPLKNTPQTWTLKARGGTVKQWPNVWWKVSDLYPRYTFISKNKIKIFPTPIKDISNWLTLAYNYMQKPLTYEQIYDDDIEESDLCLPRYFIDAVEDYMTYKLYLTENPELAQFHLQQFEKALDDNIYWANKDKRAVIEWMADTRYFSHY